MLLHQIISLLTFVLAASSLPLSKGEVVESSHNEDRARIKNSNMFGLRKNDVDSIFEKRYGYRKLQDNSPSDMPSKSLAPSGTPTVTSVNPPPTPSPSATPSATPSASPSKSPTKATSTVVKCKKEYKSKQACNAAECCKWSKRKGRCLKKTSDSCVTVPTPVKCKRLEDKPSCNAESEVCKWIQKKGRCRKLNKNGKRKGNKKVAAKAGKRKKNTTNAGKRKKNTTNAGKRIKKNQKKKNKKKE